ncbi:MAG: uroporphyrinogen decarboxylase family protein [Anaerolineae bacterium]
MPSYAGVDTLDYFLQPALWWEVNKGLLARFLDVAWLPGFWAEYGMAAEPSAFGARVVWHHDRPPSIEPVLGGLASLDGIRPADPQEHGLMPLVLRRYVDARQRLAAQGLRIRMVASRGPLAVASWLLGVSELMIALKRAPDAAQRLLAVLTETIIAWLWAQADAAGGVEGILLLDDIPGMLSPKLFDVMAAPMRPTSPWCGPLCPPRPSWAMCRRCRSWRRARLLRCGLRPWPVSARPAAGG